MLVMNQKGQVERMEVKRFYKSIQLLGLVLILSPLLLNVLSSSGASRALIELLGPGMQFSGFLLLVVSGFYYWRWIAEQRKSNRDRVESEIADLWSELHNNKEV